MATRFHMELSGDAKDRLEALKEKSEHRTLSDTAREALQLYEFLLTEYKDHGAEFYIQRKGEEREKVRLFTRVPAS